MEKAAERLRNENGVGLARLVDRMKSEGAGGTFSNAASLGQELEGALSRDPALIRAIEEIEKRNPRAKGLKELVIQAAVRGAIVHGTRK